MLRDTAAAVHAMEEHISNARDRVLTDIFPRLGFAGVAAESVTVVPGGRRIHKN